METDDLFYKASGKFNPLVVVAMPVIAATVFVLAYAYAYILVYNPFVYVNFLVFFGFCYVLGFITNYFIKLFKVRSVKTSLYLALFTGLVTLYLAWGIFLSVLLSKEGERVGVVELLSHPDHLWKSVILLANTGWYSIAGISISGVIAWITWSIEAAGFAGVPFLFALGFATSTVFCENCNIWAEEDEGVLHFNLPSLEKLKEEEIALVYEKFMEEFRVQNLRFLDKAIQAKEDDAQYFRIDAEWCKKCEETLTLSLRIIYREINDDGELEEDEDTIYEDLIVSPSTFQKVMEAKKTFGSLASA